MVVPRLMRDVIIPPAVSIPRESGDTSKSKTSFVASAASPLKIPACTAAPKAYIVKKKLFTKLLYKNILFGMYLPQLHQD